MVKKILVVDDDEGILDAVALTLEDQGYSVETSAKGEETYIKVDSFKPDLILLDVLISGSDGRHICRKLKSEQKTKGIPIIMISAHPSAHLSMAVNGADDFLAKPFDSKDLFKKISEQLNKTH